MFAGRGQQSLVLTLKADFRKVRHILFGSGYGAKVNIFKWIIILCLGRKQDLDIILVFFFFHPHLQNTPPPGIQISNFFLSPNPKLQITPPSGKSKLPTFSLSPNSKLQITPPLWKIKFPTFSLSSKFEVADYPPLENPNFTLFP